VLVKLLNRVGLTTWKRRVVAAVIAVPVVSIPTVEITSHSRFCNSCHIMEPYYASWKKGAHKDVECVKCHIPPGVTNFVSAKLNGLGQVVDDVLSRTSMKPSASGTQVSCVRSGCHDIDRLKSTKKTEGTFLFDHAKHLDKEVSGIKINCSTCHAHVKGDEHFEINTDVCITCHLVQNVKLDPEQAKEAAAKGTIRLAAREARHGAPTAVEPEGHGKLPPESCTACHTPPAGTIERGGLKITHADYLAYGARCESCHRGTTATPPPVENGQCYQCHTWGVEKSLPAEEMHRVHSEGKHKIECFSCHGSMHHGPSAQAAALENFDCRKCHADQHGVQRRAYLENGAAPATASNVSPMFVAHVDCTGCHIKPRPVSTKPWSGATVAVAVPEACDDCHKPGLGKEMIPLWQRTTHGLYEQVEKDLKALRDAGPGADAAPLLAEAQQILNAVRADGSWGVHNPRYTQKLLEQARARLAAAKAAPAGSPAK